MVTGIELHPVLDTSPESTRPHNPGRQLHLG
jgi:hypothetical protein